MIFVISGVIVITLLIVVYKSKKRKCDLRACSYNKNGYCSNEKAYNQNEEDKNWCKYFQDTYY